MLMLLKHLPSTRTLQCFLAVAQELNFRRAAELLHMSQPPLSRQIRGLEDLLRVQLIERDTRQVRLTAAGEVFMQETHALLTALERAVAATATHAQQTGQATDGVRIGLTSVLNHALIPKLNALINSPDFHGGRAVVRAMSKNLVERVRRGELDLAIVGDIAPPADDLRLEWLASEAMIAVLPEQHAAASKAEVSLADLADVPLFWFSRIDNPAFYDKCGRVFKAAGYAAPRRPEPKDFTLLLAAVAAGQGVALCPQSMQATSRMGVVYRPLTARLARQLAIDVHLVARAQETRRDVLDQVDLVRAMLAGPSVSG